MTQTQRRRDYTPPPPAEIVDVDPHTVPLAAQVIGADRLQVFVQQIARGWKRQPTAAELEQMALFFQRGRYDPWARPPQLIFTLRWDASQKDNVMTPQKTIDGLRLDAARSRDYLGQVGPQWCGDDGVWRDVWLRDEPPAAARVGVLKRGAPGPLWSVALYREWVQLADEYVDTDDGGRRKTGKKAPTSFWSAKPAHMLAKTAETMSLKRALPTETDPLALAHVEEMERLALGGHAATYDKAFGNGSGGSAYDLPSGRSFVPTDIREVDDRPRPALNAGGELVDTNTGEVLAPAPSAPAATPPPGKRELPIGALLEEYGRLLSVARAEGVVPEGEVPKWMLAQPPSRIEIVSKGTSLRAMINARQVQRTLAANPPAAADDDDDAPDDDEMADEEDDVRTMVNAGDVADLVSSVDDGDYQRLAEAIQSAAQADIDFDDCRLTLPAPREEVARKVATLEYRIQAVKEAMDANRRTALRR